MITWEGTSEALSGKIGLLGSRRDTTPCSDWSARDVPGRGGLGRIQWSRADRCAFARSRMPAHLLINHGSVRSERSRYYIFSGSRASVIRLADDRQISIDPDQIVLLRSADRLIWRLNSDYKGFSLILNEDLLEAEWPGYAGMVARPLALPLGLDQAAQSMIRAMSLALDGERFESDGDVLARSLLSLLNLSVAPAEPANPAGPSAPASRVQAIKSYLERHFADADLSLATVAEAFQLSMRYVQLIFAETSTTPSAYLLKVRLDAGAKMLRTMPQASITNIAFDCGFNSSGYFATQFRRAFGETPRAYRSLMRRADA